MNYKKQIKKAKEIKKQKFLSTGSTILNLAISDKVNGGFPIGMYTRVCGDSDTGKTWIVLTCLAEAALNENFQDYRLIYDPVENGALMDFVKYFGEDMASKLEMPRNDAASESLEDFYHNVNRAINVGKPFIYILDSMDALETKSELQLDNDNLKRADKGKKESQSYGTGKAKINSKKLGPLVSKLKKTDSILIIISQSRANIGAIGHADKKTVSGGNALKFHAAVNIWLSKKKTLKKEVRKKDRTIGLIAQVKVVRTRITGKKTTIDVPILYEIGIDDISANVEYLIDENEWKKEKGKIKAIGLLKKPMFKENLIRYIEEKGLQRKLRKIVGKVWKEIDESLFTGRVNKYANKKD